MVDKADILIVTATEVESRAVLQTFERATGRKAMSRSIDDRMYFDLGAVNKAGLFLTQSEMGTSGLDASLQTVRKGIEALNPAAVIMVGIAFGVNEQEQTIGDILVTEQLRLYDLQRVGTHGGELQIRPRGDKPHASPWLVNHLKSANLTWEGAKVRFGTVLSGEKLVDNEDFRDQLRALEPEAIGGEMEGAGLYVACHDKKVDWILVKAICDWADGQKAQDKDVRQQLAAHNSAAFLLHALRFAPIDWANKRAAAAQPSGAIQTTVGGDLSAHNIIGRDLISHETHHHLELSGFGEPPSVRSSLPPQPYFFGREKELAIILEAISPEARTWGALIDGPGGIGKTALAIKAAHRAPAELFERKIFITAKVRELTPAGEHSLNDFTRPDYLAMLDELAQELGEEALAKTHPDERANALRLALAGKNALIIFDNVETLPEDERRRLFQFLRACPKATKPSSPPAAAPTWTRASCASTASPATKPCN